MIFYMKLLKTGKILFYYKVVKVVLVTGILNRLQTKLRVTHNLVLKGKKAGFV